MALDRVAQVGEHRHRQLRRRSRRRRAQVGSEIAQGRVGLMPHGRDDRDRAVRDRAHHHLFVERPQILDRPAAARDDDEIGSRHRAIRGDRIEAAHRRRHLFRRALPLHLDRPDDDMAGAAILQPVQDIADHRAGRRRHHPDRARQIGQRDLALAIEQPLARQLGLQFLEQRHQRARAGQLHPLDDDLIFRPAGIGGQLAGRDHLDPVLRRKGERVHLPLPHHAVDHRGIVLQR